MAGYPIASEMASSMDRLPETCPYTIEEMEEYLFVNHYHWSRQEPPTTFSVSGPCAQKAEADRRCWLFEAVKDRLARREEIWCPQCQKQHVLEPLHEHHSDNEDRQWFIVVGTGKGFSGGVKLRRWMYAQTNDDDMSPEQFLDQEYRSIP